MRAERLAKEAPVEAPQPHATEELSEQAPQKAPSPERSLEIEPATTSDIAAKSSDDFSVQPLSDIAISTPAVAIPIATMTSADENDMSRTDSQQTPIPGSATQPTSEPIGLGISTDVNAAQSQSQDPLTATAEGATSAIDSLFDLPDTANGDDTFNFDDMDFSVDATNNQDPSQVQTAEFDLSTFGNDTQDFAMLDIPVANSTNQTNIPTSKEDDIFADLGAVADGDMDLDLGNMDMGEGNSFDDLFLAGDGDDLNTGTGEMEHGDFDREFFGLE